MTQRLIQFGTGPTRGEFSTMFISKIREGGMSIRARLSSRPRMTPYEGGGRASASWIHSPRIYVPHRPWRGSSEGPNNQRDKYLKVLYKSIRACLSLSANNNRPMELSNVTERLTKSKIEQVIPI